MRCSLPLLTLLALGTLAPAAESISAIQLKVGQVPGIDTNEKEAQDLGSGGIYSSETSLDPKTGMGISLGLRAASLNESGLGLSYEGNLFYRTHEGTQTGGRDELTAYGIELGLDAAFAPMADLLLLAGPRVGLGVGNQTSHPDAGYTSSLEDGMGYYLSYGVQAEVTYSIAKHLMIGGYAGWMGFTSGASRDLSASASATGTVDVTMSGSGATYGAILGYQF